MKLELKSSVNTKKETIEIEGAQTSPNEIAKNLVVNNSSQTPFIAVSTSGKVNSGLYIIIMGKNMDLSIKAFLASNTLEIDYIDSLVFYKSIEYHLILLGMASGEESGKLVYLDYNFLTNQLNQISGLRDTIPASEYSALQVKSGQAYCCSFAGEILNLKLKF